MKVLDIPRCLSLEQCLKAGKPCGNFKWLAILDFSQLIGFAAESVCANRKCSTVAVGPRKF